MQIKNQTHVKFCIWLFRFYISHQKNNLLKSKHKEYAEQIKELFFMIVQNNAKTFLQPALVPFGCCSSLPVRPGKYICSIHVDRGTILLRHAAYNIETGCWEDRPDGNDPAELWLHEGDTKELDFTCKDHYGHPDNLWIFNSSYLKPAVFTCSYQKQ